MSVLSELTNPGKDDLLPGHTLSRPGIVQYAKAEEHFQSEYVTSVKRDLAGLPDGVVSTVMSDVCRWLATGPFRYPSVLFKTCLLAHTSLPHLVLWSMQVKDKDIKLPKVVELLADAPNLAEIAEETYRLWGYSFGGKADAAGSKTETGSPSTGEPSSGGAAPLPPTDSGSPPINSDG